MNNADMPVTPIVNDNGRVQPFTDDNGFSSMATGMTKREAFAMAAMQGLLSNSEPNSWSEDQWYKAFSSQAVNHADALLKELDKDSK